MIQIKTNKLDFREYSGEHFALRECLFLFSNWLKTIKSALKNGK
jgi:hypothetical protein